MAMYGNFKQNYMVTGNTFSLVQPLYKYLYVPVTEGVAIDHAE